MLEGFTTTIVDEPIPSSGEVAQRAAAGVALSVLAGVISGTCLGILVLAASVM